MTHVKTMDAIEDFTKRRLQQRKSHATANDITAELRTAMELASTERLSTELKQWLFNVEEFVEPTCGEWAAARRNLMNDFDAWNK